MGNTCAGYDNTLPDPVISAIHKQVRARARKKGKGSGHWEGREYLARGVDEGLPHERVCLMWDLWGLLSGPKSESAPTCEKDECCLGPGGKKVKPKQTPEKRRKHPV